MTQYVTPASPPSSELVRVGATIRAMREMSGMTQEQLSRVSMLSRAYVANVEAGRKRASRKAIARIATALHVPQISLIADEEPAPTSRPTSASKGKGRAA